MITLLRILALLIILPLLQSCTMQKIYSKSFLDLRDKTATNYTQQVVDVIAGLKDNATLPVFIMMEGGNSTWNPGVTGNIASTIPGPWNSRTTGFGTGVQGTDTASNAVQFNDYGSASMLRINSLYEYLCFPYKFGEVVFPHGTLYACASEADTDKGLFFAKKLHNGKYLGIPPEKKAEFLTFASEVTYWSQHANPDLKDLRSSPGVFYRFSIEYYPAISGLLTNVQTKNKLLENLKTATADVQATGQDLNSLFKKNTVSHTSPVVVAKIMQLKQDQLKAKVESMMNLQSNLAKLGLDIRQFTNSLDALFRLTEETLRKVPSYEPTVSAEAIENTLQKISEQIKKAKSGDASVLDELTPSINQGKGLSAEESMEKLYHQQFESLPMRYDSAGQAAR